MVTQQTCEERIADHLKGRLESFKAVNKATQCEDVAELTDEELQEVTNLYEPKRDEYTAQELNEQAEEMRRELPLAVSTQRIVRVDLSTGGPADWFECLIDEDGTIGRISYHFQDWFDGAVRILEANEFDAAAEFLGYFTQS